MHEHVKGRVPVSVVNGIIKPEQAHYLIENGLTDTVDSAKALLADPNWAKAVTDGATHLPCRSCKMCGWSPMVPEQLPGSDRTT